MPTLRRRYFSPYKTCFYGKKWSYCMKTIRECFKINVVSHKPGKYAKDYRTQICLSHKKYVTGFLTDLSYIVLQFKGKGNELYSFYIITILLDMFDISYGLTFLLIVKLWLCHLKGLFIFFIRQV